MQPAISLVVATYDRTETLDRLFASIVEQDWPALEVILVDQNEDDRLQPVLLRWQAVLALRVLRLAPAHLSRARNLGMQAAQGDIIAFPDDDCWYSPALFARVAAFFRERREFDILSVKVLDELGVASGNRWVQDRCELAPINIFRTSVTYGSFFRRRALPPAIRFDEGIGPNAGTPFGCGEDTDLVLQAMRQGARGYFNASLFVHHPRKDMLSGNASKARAHSYGMGMGHVLAKHRMRVLFFALFAYDLLRAAACLFRGKAVARGLCMAHARGIFAGYRHTVSKAPVALRAGSSVGSES